MDLVAAEHLDALSSKSPHKGCKQIHRRNFHYLSTKDHLSSRSIKVYVNITSSIKSPGLSEARGEVSVCSRPIYMNSIVIFARDGKLK